MKRERSTGIPCGHGDCYRVLVQYSPCTDFKFENRLVKAIKQATGLRRPDSGCSLPDGVRDLEYDEISFKRGLTKKQAIQVATVAADLGAYATIRKTLCRIQQCT